MWPMHSSTDHSPGAGRRVSRAPASATSWRSAPGVSPWTSAGSSSPCNDSSCCWYSLGLATGSGPGPRTGREDTARSAPVAEVVPEGLQRSSSSGGHLRWRERDGCLLEDVARGQPLAPLLEVVGSRRDGGRISLDDR